MKYKGAFLLLASFLTLALTDCSPSKTKSQPGVEAILSDAVDVCIYGFPLMIMDTTRKQVTNVASPEATRAPMGQILRMRTYPTAA